MPTETNQLLDAVAGHLRQAQRVLFITGAGISADSGLPTYRGVGGLYNSGQTEEGYSIEHCLSATMFRSKPEITWKYMLGVGEAVVKCKPNPAHEIIAKWEREFENRGGKVVVFTQNIDGYHRKAGSVNVLEIHGTLRKLFCTECNWETEIDLDGTDNQKLQERLAEFGQSLPPRCPKCNAVIRPQIVLFEEMLPRKALEEFDREFQNGTGFDMVFTIGTSAMFPYITSPVLYAGRCGKTTVEINPAVSELSDSVTFHIPLRAAEALAQLDERLN
ncbi:NAD-dependent protein deacylase 2 [Planctomycetales bacterium]|nr:NAD-dependent protein deacylase 2 [Planctomycetales bacterium]